MLDNLIQQFAGGGHESMGEKELHGHVDQMLQAAPNPQSAGAVEQALGALGAGGFAQSVLEGARSASPQERNTLADTLLGAISQGGGSPNNVLSELGIGGRNMGPGELAQLAQHVMSNHPDALAGQLGGQLQNGDQGNGLLSLLGNPMVRQIGMQLVQKVM